MEILEEWLKGRKEVEKFSGVNLSSCYGHAEVGTDNCSHVCCGIWISEG